MKEKLDANEKLCSACKEGNILKIKAALEEGADVDYNEGEPLAEAIQMHKNYQRDKDLNDIITSLVAKFGATEYDKAFIRSVRCERQDLVKYFLIKLRVDANVDEAIALEEACLIKNEKVSEEMVELLFKYGANPNLISEDSKTPLHILFEAGIIPTKKVIELFLENNVNTNIVNDQGNNILHMLVGALVDFTTCPPTNETQEKYKQNISQIIDLLLDNNPQLKEMRNNEGKVPYDILKVSGYENIKAKLKVNEEKQDKSSEFVKPLEKQTMVEKLEVERRTRTSSETCYR